MILIYYRTVLGMVNHINPDQLVQVYDLLDDVDSETPSGIRSSYAVAQGRIEATKTTELFHRRTDIAEGLSHYLLSSILYVLICLSGIIKLFPNPW